MINVRKRHNVREDVGCFSVYLCNTEAVIRYTGSLR